MDSPLAQIITVDGSSLDVPKFQRAERKMGFIQIAAQLFKLTTLEKLESDPMMDPREANRLINRAVHHLQATLPLAGIHLPGRPLLRLFVT